MDLTCDATQLSTALHLLAPFITRSPLGTFATSHAILIDATATEGPLRCYATTMEMGAEIALPITAAQHGIAAIPGRPLIEFVRQAPEGPIRLQAEDERLLVSTGEASIQLKTLPHTTFQRPPTPPHSLLTLPAETLAALLRRTVFAAGTDAHQTQLTGILLHVKGETIRLVATNGHRLAYATHSLPPNVPSNGSHELAVESLVPRRSAHALQALLQSLTPTDPATISITSRTLVMTGPNTLFHTRLLHDYTYPDYEQILSAPAGPRCEVQRAPLLSALRQATALLMGAWAPTEVTLGEDSLTIKATGDNNEAAQVSVPAKWTSEAITITLNGRYLSDWLETMEDETALLEIREPLQPVRCAAPDTPGSGYILMPMRPPE